MDGEKDSSDAGRRIVDSRSQDNIIELDASDVRKARRQIEQMAEVRLLDIPELEARKIIYSGMEDRNLLNLFRDIRAKLLQRTGSENFVLMVCSVCDQGGASLFALNTAVSFALDPAKTAILVDCNIYNPHVDSLLTISPDYGLTDYLENPNIDIDEIIYSSGIERLRIVPVGSRLEGASELFSSLRMVELIQSIKKRYADRFVVLDVPPINFASDARVIASLCDMAIMVVPYGKSTENQVEAGIDVIGEDKLAGVVFNQL